MGGLFSIIAKPLGWIMLGCYYLVKNYGVALILFTLVTKLILFPMSVKQQKNTAKMARLNPKIENLKKKYGKNPQKLQEEQMKLYQEENVNPMSSCLPLVITFVLLFALIDVVYYPLTYVTSIDKDKISESTQLVSDIYTVSDYLKDENLTIEGILNEGKDLKEVLSEDKDVKKIVDDDLVTILTNYPTIDIYFQNNIPKTMSQRPQLMLFGLVEDGYGDLFDSEVTEEIKDFDYTFLGQFMGGTPSWKNSLVWIPIVSLIANILMTVIQQYLQKKTNPAMANMGMGMNIMLFIMPLFSFWFAFQVPAGVGLYWIFSSVFSTVQTVVLNKVYTPEYVEKLIDKEAAKNKKKKKKPSMYERALAAQQQANGTATEVSEAEEVDESTLSRAELKDLQKKKLNEARRRMAEKYGDEYVEDEE